LDPEDRQLFRDSVADVQELSQERVEPHRPATRPRRQPDPPPEREMMAELLLEEGLEPGIEAGDELFYARPGLQHGVKRKLRRGHYSVGAVLDLHGMNGAAAMASVVGFLGEARDRSIGCVRIIHGKGLRSSNRGPVLKSRLDRLLRRRDEVLAFCTARPKDGGAGAVYVLLRRGSGPPPR
jgi:DNA-nicking Smr family endonuclease